MPYVICAGGTQLGDRDGVADEGPWNDLDFAGGGGISNEPRPAWQNAPGDFLFSTTYVKNRIVPDVSADAAGRSEERRVGKECCTRWMMDTLKKSTMDGMPTS